MKPQPAVRDLHTAGGFLWVNNGIYDAFFSQLGPCGVAVYMVLARYANNETQTAFPSANRIAEDVGISGRQVFRELKKLDKLGLISIEARTKPRSSAPTSNLYTLLAIPTDADGDDDPATDSHVPDDYVTDSHIPVCHTVISPATHGHLASDCESPKQDSVNKKHISTTTTRSQSSAISLSSHCAVVVGVGIPNELERLIDTLLISGRLVRERIASAYELEPDRVMTWALVLASSEYCQLSEIRSPSGFFLHVLQSGTQAPTLVSPQSQGACPSCGDSGYIEIRDNPKGPKELTIYSCPVCGKTPEVRDESAGW